MQNFLVLLPLVASAMTCHAATVDYSKWEPEQPVSEARHVSWKQTQDHPTKLSGGLGSSVEGYFPKMSSDKIGMGCGVDWKNGEVHAGFDGGDPKNGAGGGFTWTSEAMSSIVGVHYQDTVINLNVTITRDNEVLFNVNGKDLDWNKVIKTEKKHDKCAVRTRPEGKDAGPVQFLQGRPFATDIPEQRLPPAQPLTS